VTIPVAVDKPGPDLLPGLELFLADFVLDEFFSFTETVPEAEEDVFDLRLYAGMDE
jgi:hypothetical protein